MTARSTSRGIWARLAREAGGPATPATTSLSEVVVASCRCQRCGRFCPSCSAPPAGWATVSQRPERLDTEALAAALFELEPPVDEPGVRRTRPLQRPTGGAR